MMLFTLSTYRFGALSRRQSVLSAFLLVVLLLSPVVAFGQTLDEPFTVPADSKNPIGALTAEIFQFGIILIVLAAAIYIAIGAYMYFVASGNAESAKTGKEYISRAIIGLVLGLLAWVILKTISPQFTDLPTTSKGEFHPLESTVLASSAPYTHHSSARSFLK